jgi:hypothetical protein
VLAFWRSAAVLGAHELGIFAALAAGPDGPDALAARLGLRPDALADLLDALVGLSLLEREGLQYANASVAALFLDPAQPAYLGTFLAMAADAMRTLCDLAAQLREPVAPHADQPVLAARMWADIAAIVRDGFPGD